MAEIDYINLSILTDIVDPNNLEVLAPVKVYFDFESDRNGNVTINLTSIKTTDTKEDIDLDDISEDDRFDLLELIYDDFDDRLARKLKIQYMQEQWEIDYEKAIEKGEINE